MIRNTYQERRSRSPCRSGFDPSCRWLSETETLRQTSSCGRISVVALLIPLDTGWEGAITRSMTVNRTRSWSSASHVGHCKELHCPYGFSYCWD